MTYDPKAEYQGWTNYATWNVALWVSNSEPMYREMQLLRPYTPQKARLFCERLFPSKATPDMRDEHIGQQRLMWDSIDWASIAEDFNAQ